MRDVLNSHIVQFLYHDAQTLNFAQIVGDVRTAFAPASGPAAILTWDCDDIALLDFDAARVVIGFSENLPGVHTICLTVATDQKLMCRAITRRLNRRYPPAARNSQIVDQPLTPELIDRVVEALFDQIDDTAQTAALSPSVDAFPEVAANLTPAEPNDMNSLIDRLSSELTTRPANIISRAIASATIPAPTPTATANTVVPLASKAAKLSAGLFWRKTPNGAVLRPHPQNHTSAAELKAVREALYANVSDHGASRFATQTKQTLWGAISMVADLRRGLSPAIGARFKP